VVLPSGSRVVVVKGRKYHYHKGVYYWPGKNSYVVIGGPVGFSLSVLPTGYRRYYRLRVLQIRRLCERHMFDNLESLDIHSVRRYYGFHDSEYKQRELIDFSLMSVVTRAGSNPAPENKLI